MKITLELTDTDVAVLGHDLPGLAGIEAWVKDMLAGKIDSCAKRMARDALELVRSGKIDARALPDMTQASLAGALLAFEGYENRAQREAKAAADQAKRAEEEATLRRAAEEASAAARQAALLAAIEAERETLIAAARAAAEEAARAVVAAAQPVS